MKINGNDNYHSWEAIYQAGDAGWDISAPAPPFKELLANKPDWLVSGEVICFGAGPGHDANLFAQNGFTVTAVDFAPSAIALINKYAENSQSLKPLLADILSIPSSYASSFDYVLEHTCFCAIPVANRQKYVQAAAEVLRPGGILFGLFYRFDPPDDKGPPYYVSTEQVQSLFADHFEVLEWRTPLQSHGKRQDRERFIAMRVKK